MTRTSSSPRRPLASRPKPVRKKLVRTKPVQKKPLRKNPVPKKKPIPQTPRQRELTTKRRGELAELAFVLKAANLGFGVARLPLHALRGVTSLLFRRHRDRRPGLYDAYREAWHLLSPKP